MCPLIVFTNYSYGGRETSMSNNMHKPTKNRNCVMVVQQKKTNLKYLVPFIRASFLKFLYKKIKATLLI